VVALSFAACGARTGLLVEDAVDSLPSADAAADVEADARVDVDAEADGEADAYAGADADVVADVEPEADAPACKLGNVTGDAFGNTVYFANGAALPAGTYRVTYVDGCMKYSASQDWSVNAYGLNDPAGSDHWWFVANGQRIASVIPPGTVGFLVGQGGFATFDECVQANLALPPVDITIPAGPLGVWLEDNPYGDNVPGLNGRSPTWSLQCAQ
jgi:hypothetical protein